VIYLDHHAATPLSPRAEARIGEVRAQAWANPSSIHAAGRAARKVLETARDEVAQALGGSPNDVVFTSGGTEACNLGVLGLGLGRGSQGGPGSYGGPAKHVLASRTEHPAVLRAVEELGARGAKVEWIAPDGLLDAVTAKASPETLVTAQWVNHETGTLWPVESVVAAARAAGARIFVDACQAFGKVPVRVSTLDADAVAVAAHKLGGPAGAGALWVSRAVDVPPMILGGAQERGRRAGTPDVVTLAGFGAAALGVEERVVSMPVIGIMRDALEAGLVELGAMINGHPAAATRAPRVATAVNASFKGWKGESLVAALDLEGVCISAGPACSSGVSAPSPVVTALHPDEPWRAGSSVRFSFGPESNAGDVPVVLAALRAILARKT
jgi:cysteine desulfurase